MSGLHYALFAFCHHWIMSYFILYGLHFVRFVFCPFVTSCHVCTLLRSHSFVKCKMALVCLLVFVVGFLMFEWKWYEGCLLEVTQWTIFQWPTCEDHKNGTFLDITVLFAEMKAARVVQTSGSPHFSTLLACWTDCHMYYLSINPNPRLTLFNHIS